MKKNQILTIISYNIGSNSHLAGLSQILVKFRPSLIFLQEVRHTTNQLNVQLGRFYEGSCNIDVKDTISQVQQ